MQSKTAVAALIGIVTAAASLSSALAQSRAPGAAQPRPNKLRIVPPAPPPPNAPDKFQTRINPSNACPGCYSRDELGRVSLPPLPDDHIDGRARADAARREADAIFAESETALALLPREQAMWVRAFASSRRGRADDAVIRAAIAAAFPATAHEQKVMIHKILLLTMMGDIVGALRSYTIQQNGDMRRFTRMIVKKLNGIRNARSAAIANLARLKPHAGDSPSLPQRAQDKSSRYTQFVQLSTQLMSELQSSERELVDALQSMHRRMSAIQIPLASVSE